MRSPEPAQKGVHQIEYALLRYRHSQTAGELVNVGVLLWDGDANRLHYEIPDRCGRLSQFIHGFNGPAYLALLRALRHQVDGKAKEILSIPGLNRADAPSFEDILTSIVPRDHSCFVWSNIMGGICRDPVKRITQLRNEFLDQHEDTSTATCP